jgi:hypothetical protein
LTRLPLAALALAACAGAAEREGTLRARVAFPPQDTVRFEAPATARPCGRPGALVAHGSSGGNGVLVWLRYGDSLTSGDYPVLWRGDTAMSHGAVIGVRFMTGALTHGAALDSGVVTVSHARDRLVARARGSGQEVGGQRRARIEAEFDAPVLGGDTVPCHLVP